MKYISPCSLLERADEKFAFLELQIGKITGILTVTVVMVATGALLGLSVRDNHQDLLDDTNQHTRQKRQGPPIRSIPRKFFVKTSRRWGSKHKSALCWRMVT